MTKLDVKYATYGKAPAPRPMRLSAQDHWAGAPQKMRDGSEPQPWHCLPFVEGSTYGLELVYPFENECHVVNDGTDIRFEWDYATEPGGGVTGGEFITFFPKAPSKFYLFNARIDVQAPPGHVLRTEPHPRYFTDETGMVPLAMIGHVQSEWYPRQLFVVFRAPRPGERHVFRKGEPYAQILFVPQQVRYELTRMEPAQEAERRELERSITAARSEIATNRWLNPSGNEFNNHYKVLARAFADGGMAAVRGTVARGVEKHEQSLPSDKSIDEALAVGHAHLDAGRYDEARAVFGHVLARDPANADALSHLGIAVACTGSPAVGVEMMTRAVELQPGAAALHANLGEVLRMTGRFGEAAAAFRAALRIRPDAGLVSVLGLTLAQQGKFDEALQACRAALNAAPQSAVVQYRAGLVHALRSDPRQARAHYERALATDANFMPARQALRELSIAEAPSLQPAP
jgi:tetratricopeptide (TPR) repeat protein